MGAIVTRRVVRSVAVLALFAVAGGALVIVSGIVPVKSDGHWPVTAWMLDFIKRRSVATHSIGIDVPPLDTPWVVLKGAAHYEYGCRPCHGSPLGPPPTVTERMTPHPPLLAPLVPRWDPEELFYLVKHGIKFTGMPGWTALRRDDEIWAVIAFLRTLPGLDAETYGRQVLTAGPAHAGATAPGTHASAHIDAASVADEQCAQCHGRDGRGRTEPAFPRLAGQKVEYLRGALQAYASHGRHSGTMGPVAAGLSEEVRADLAAHYASLAGVAEPARAGTSERPFPARGQAIAEQGIPARDIPPCVECHASGDARHAAYPRLGGQFAEYLELQLQLFKEGRRGGAATAHLMAPIAGRLTADEMRDVAAYFAATGSADVSEDAP
jgi:cytochrome c553